MSGKILPGGFAICSKGVRGVGRVVIYGLGDLGEKLAYLCASQLSFNDELWLAGRSQKTVAEIAAMADFVACSRHGPRIYQTVWDLSDQAAMQTELDHIAPDVVIFLATRLTWWKVAKLPTYVKDAIGPGGFGVWTAVHVDLLLQFAAVVEGLRHAPWLMIGPYPDVAAPILRAIGLEKIAGFGNVDELAMLAALQYREADDIRLVAHHSVESRLFAGTALPPYDLHVRIGGEWVKKALFKPFDWPGGTRSHIWTAASAMRTLLALLGSHPELIHIPGPMGLPGGYPCRVSANGIVLDLAPRMSPHDAVVINEAAMKFDGIEQIGPSGTVYFTKLAQEALRQGLGLNWEALSVSDIPMAANVLVRRYQELLENSSVSN